MNDVLTTLFFALLSIFIGSCVFLLWKVTKTITNVLSELFVFYRIFTGGSNYRSTSRPLRLYTYVCATQYLDEITVNELFQFVKEDVKDKVAKSDEESIKSLHSVILSYSHVALFREKTDGSLRGMMLVGLVHTKEYTLIKTGLWFLKNHYKGGPYFYIVAAYFVLKELILHPFTPLYIVGKAFSYKSYLVLSKFNEHYPRYDKETPDYFKKILSEYAHSVMAKGDMYNEETSVIEQERTRLKENVAPITEQDLQNPRIKFFVEQNPGWEKGHCFVGGLRTSWPDLLAVIFQGFVKSIKSKSEAQNHTSQLPGLKDGKPKPTSIKRKRPPKLLKRYTFQEISANAYAVNMYEMDITGEAILSPTNNYAFQFSPTLQSDPEASLSEINI